METTTFATAAAVLSRSKSWNLNDWCALHFGLHAERALAEHKAPSTSSAALAPPPSSTPLDTIGESARNRFGRPYISGRPLLSIDRRQILDMHANGARKIAIARAIGVTHSCVSKVIRRFEETGAFDNRGSQTKASCACPGEALAHDPKICRHVKFRAEQKRVDGGGRGEQAASRASSSLSALQATAVAVSSSPLLPQAPQSRKRRRSSAFSIAWRVFSVAAAARLIAAILQDSERLVLRKTTAAVAPHRHRAR